MAGERGTIRALIVLSHHIWEKCIYEFRVGLGYKVGEGVGREHEKTKKRSNRKSEAMDGWMNGWMDFLQKITGEGRVGTLLLSVWGVFLHGISEGRAHVMFTTFVRSSVLIRLLLKPGAWTGSLFLH